MIKDTLHKYYDEIANRYPDNEIVGIFLFGSQNYNLDTDYSDVDAIAIICPSWNNVIFAERPISTTIHLDDGDIKLMDIRHALRDMAKPTIFSMEALYAKYEIINPKYFALWNEIVKNRELIANSDIDNMLNSILGMAHQVYKDFHKAYNDGEMVGARKRASRLVFINHFLSHYLKGDDVEDCYRCDDSTKQEYLYVKYDAVNELLPDAVALLEEIESMAKTADKHEINPEASEMLNNIRGKIVKLALTDNPL